MKSQSAKKKTCVCECSISARVAVDTVRLEFFWPGPAPRPGQFFLVKPRRSGVFLARPISVAGWEPPTSMKQPGLAKSAGKLRVDDGGTLRFLVALKGRGSRELTEMMPGDEAELTGPLGNSWPLELIPRGPVALVAGGIGIAPLLALATELGKNHDEHAFDFYAGFRSGSFGQKMKARNLVITTEDGSVGEKGRVTDFFTPSEYSVVFACGPEPMLKRVANMCAADKVPCFISVEKHMACGVGACLGCTVKTSNGGNTVGNQRCCVEGPVFNAEEVCFEG